MLSSVVLEHDHEDRISAADLFEKLKTSLAPQRLRVVGDMLLVTQRWSDWGVQSNFCSGRSARPVKQLPLSMCWAGTTQQSVGCRDTTSKGSVDYMRYILPGSAVSNEYSNLVAGFLL